MSQGHKKNPGKKVRPSGWERLKRRFPTVEDVTEKLDSLKQNRKGSAAYIRILNEVKKDNERHGRHRGQQASSAVQGSNNALASTSDQSDAPLQTISDAPPTDVEEKKDKQGEGIADNGLVSAPQNEDNPIHQECETSDPQTDEKAPTCKTSANIFDEPPQCPKCIEEGKDPLMKSKELRYNKWSTKRVYYCPIHGIKKTPKSYSTKIPVDSLQKMEEAYFEHDSNMESLQEKLPPGREAKTQTIANALRNRAQGYAEVLKKRSPEIKMRTGFKVGDKKYLYMLVDSTDTSPSMYLDVCLDATSGHTLGHQNADTKTAEKKIELLRKVRDLGYTPDLVVVDEDQSWIEAIKNVFPDSTITYCAFHLKKRLNEKLPTKPPASRGLPFETRRLYRFVKYNIFTIADALDFTLASELKQTLEHARPHWKRDAEATTAVEQFLEKTQMYLQYLYFPGAPNTTGRLEVFFKHLKKKKAVKETTAKDKKADFIDILIYHRELRLLNTETKPPTTTNSGKP